MGSREITGSLDGHGQGAPLSLEADRLVELPDRQSLLQAIRLYETARFDLPRGTSDYGGALMSEGVARSTLAQMGGEPPDHLHQAIRLYEAARRCFQPGSPSFGAALVNEGNARRVLAGLGEEPLEHLHRAVHLYEAARRCIESGSPDYGRALINEGMARRTLARLGEKPIEHLSRTMELSEAARGCFEAGSGEYGRALMNEANARSTLAELGEEPPAHLHRAIRLYAAARDCCEAGSLNYGAALMNEGVAHETLAELGEEPSDHLHRALQLYEAARDCCEPGSPHHGAALMSEGNVHRALAGSGEEPLEHLHRAIQLYEAARDCLGAGSPDYGLTLMNEGNIHQELAGLGEEPLEQLHRAIQLCEAARNCFGTGSPDYGRALMSEANARSTLAELGVERSDHLHRAIRLYDAADRCFLRGSLDLARNQLRLSVVLRESGELERAEQCRRAALSILERMRGQLHPAREPVDFQETVGRYYAGMAKWLVEKARQAEDAGDGEAAEGYRWEAWQCVHRSKARALRQVLPPGRLPSPQGVAELWKAYDRQRVRLDHWIRNSRAQRQQPGDDNGPPEPVSAGYGRDQQETPRGRVPGYPYGWWRFPACAPPCEDLRRAEEAYLRERAGLEDRLRDGRALPDVRDPQETLASLRLLAGSDQDPQRRPLLVEFCVTAQSEALAFVVPLWRDEGLPALAVHRVELLPEILDRKGFSSSAAALERALTAGGDLQPEDHAATIAGVVQLDALVLPWGHYLDEWEPTELVLSPHDWLSLLPLHAARWRAVPLIERLPVVYLPSPTWAEETFANTPDGRVRRGVPAAWSEALILANPLTGVREVDDLLALPNAPREAAAVCRLLEAHDVRSHLCEGGKAASEAVLNHAERAGIFHASVHSVLDRRDPLRAGLELADARFTVFDIMHRVDLSRSVLAYLSSCEGALVAPGGVDGLAVLARAFLYAGSPTVIAPLWPVDDAAAAEFAGHFYRLWTDQPETGPSRTLAEAFREAVQAVKKNLSGKEALREYFWAPFVLLGAWATRFQPGVDAPAALPGEAPGLEPTPALELSPGQASFWRRLFRLITGEP